MLWLVSVGQSKPALCTVVFLSTSTDVALRLREQIYLQSYTFLQVISTHVPSVSWHVASGVSSLYLSSVVSSTGVPRVSRVARAATATSKKPPGACIVV